MLLHIRLHISRGTRAIYMAPLSVFPTEMELLLPRNKTYQVTNIFIVGEENKYILIDADILVVGPKSMQGVELNLPYFSK